MAQSEKEQDDYRITYYNAVSSKTVDWLWYPYIPYGKITILQGDPGEGKSTMMMQLAALITNGKAMPDGSGDKIPGNVIYQAAEDGIEDTIKPRLEAAGADCSRIAFLEQSDEEPILLNDGLHKNGIYVAVSRTVINIIILLITCAVYTYSLLHGFKGISKLANICIYMFFGLIAFVLLFGGETRYIIETGFSSLGRMIQNFVDLSTFTDPLRTSNFPQNWTIYYWAYWMVWCVAAPFFIGSISRGRTVRQTILGGYVFGVGSTLTSFIVLGNYSMGMQVTGKADFIAQYLESGDLYGMIVSIIKTMPCAHVIMVVVLLTMIAFYATSFDSIALTASCYSYHRLGDNEQPNKGIQLMWCILLILLPIALLFAESSMNNLQSVSIVAAFPIGAVIVMIAVSFMKDAKKYMENLEKSAKEKGEK